MSRIGKKPVPLPSGVKVSVQNSTIKTAGPKGELSWSHPAEVAVEVDDSSNLITVTRTDDSSRSKAMHGLTRALIANMITGVTDGYTIGLEIYGTGYGCQVKGKQLLLNCGHMGRGIDAEGKPREAQFYLDIPDGVEVKIDVPAARGDSDPAKMSVSGIDKQLVGQFAADVRRTRPPEPYKGKGIRYAGEHVRRKQGKAFAGGG